MADEQHTQDQNTPPDGALNTDVSGNTVPYARFKEVNDARRALESRLAALEAAQADAEKQRLEEQQNYQQLAETYRKELEALKPVAGQVNDWQASIKATVAAQIEQLPEDRRGLVPEFDDPRRTLDWLNKNAATLMKPLAPDLDGGARGDSGQKPVKLTPGQQKAARAAGMSDEAYIAALTALERNKPKE